MSATEQAPGRGGRAALALGVALLTLLLAEGLLSLAAGRSLRDLLGLGLGEAPLYEPPGAPSVPDANSRESLAIHADPLVALTLRRSGQVSFAGELATTDALGMRVRVGPPVADDAYRIVLLGDSVAFGYGMSDAEAPAQRLENVLALALPGTPRRVECRTVAVPGWTHRNAVHFLLDHLESYRPDLVLYMPVSNDLADSYSVTGGGQRSNQVPDVSQVDPLLRVDHDTVSFLIMGAVRRQKELGDRTLTERALGPAALNADLSAESSRRYDENLASILMLEQRLAERGARLALLRFRSEPYAWHLFSRLDEAGSAAPIVPLFDSYDIRLQLDGDPHPNGPTLQVMALWCAQDLAALGWVPGLHAGELPPVPPAFTEGRAPRRTAAERKVLSDQARDADRLALRPRIDSLSGEGLRQVYGGFNPDGSVGRRALALLPAGGQALELELTALLTHELSVELDGVVLDVLALEAGQELRVSLPLPPGSDRPRELGLRASRVLFREVDGFGYLSSVIVGSVQVR